MRTGYCRLTQVKVEEEADGEQRLDFVHHQGPAENQSL